MTTITKSFTVKNQKGWHARPCALIARTIVQHPDITVTFSHPNQKTVASGSSVFEMMLLAVNCGDTIVVQLTGEDLQELQDLLSIIEKIIDRPFLDEDF